MKNRNIETSLDLKLVARSRNNIQFYISKKLLIDLNDKNITINESGLSDYDYFILNIYDNGKHIDLYKPHYIGKQSCYIEDYLDRYIIKQIEDLANIHIIGKVID